MSRGRGRQGSSVVVLETLRKNSQATSIYFENNKFLKTCRLQHYTKYVEIALQMLANSSFLGPADVTPGFLVSWTWCVSSGFAHPRLQSGPRLPPDSPFPGSLSTRSAFPEPSFSLLPPWATTGCLVGALLHPDLLGFHARPRAAEGARHPAAGGMSSLLCWGAPDFLRTCDLCHVPPQPSRGSLVLPRGPGTIPPSAPETGGPAPT